MNQYQNKREVSEAYVQAAINLDIPLVKYLLTSDELAYKADINFDEAVVSNLCSSDTKAELTKYLFTSPDLKEHLKFSYPGLRSALIYNNVAVTQFLLKNFDKKYNLDNYLCGEWGIFEVDTFSKEMVECLYFEYAKPGTRQALLENLISHDKLESINQILQSDPDIDKKQVLQLISKSGSYEMFNLFDEITHYSSDKKNIPRIVNASCNKEMDVGFLESLIKNAEFTGYYDMNSRVFKKIMNRSDLLTILIVDRNAQMTPAIENICSPQAKEMFAARDLSNRLNTQLTQKSKMISRKL